LTALPNPDTLVHQDPVAAICSDRIEDALMTCRFVGLLATLAFVILWAPLASDAQFVKVPRIGVLAVGSPPPVA
jgi:hypothetical protein